MGEGHSKKEPGGEVHSKVPVEGKVGEGRGGEAYCRCERSVMTAQLNCCTALLYSTSLYLWYTVGILVW